MKNRTYCEHCYPADNNHIPDRMGSLLDYFLMDPMSSLLSPLSPFTRNAARLLKRGFLEFSTAIKHIRLSEELDRKKINNGALVFWDEARKRQLPIYNLKLLNRHTEHFCVMIEDKKYFYDTNPIFLLNSNSSYNQASRFDDKENLRKILISHQLPCPRGSAFVSKEKALNYGKTLGFPLIVKPSFSSQSSHVSLNINSEQDLRRAINIAKQVNYKIIVEKHIPGEVFRALVLGDTLIACSKRQAARVIGNGRDTIEKLIEERNKHPYRGEPGEKNYTLFKVKMTPHLVQTLKNQGVRLNTKLAKGVQILLSPKMNTGNSGDIINVTDQVHPENKALLEKAHKILNLPLSGLDFICSDIATPWQDQPFAIIENNSLPSISLHHFPTAGEPINVAAKIWDFVLEKISTHNTLI